MKAILVRDEMPTNCGDCEFCIENVPHISLVCVAAYCEHIDNHSVNINLTKPDWCPWRPAPERREQSREGDYAVGWNDLRDAIMEECEEPC